MGNRTLMLMLNAAIALSTLRALPVEAGCGCAKPPPLLNAVRPSFASPGDTVTIFPPDNKPGRYFVRFESTQRIASDAVLKRDLADGLYKWQVVVQAPQMPAGPTRIKVDGPRGNFEITREDFTMMQAPLVLQQNDGETVATCYSAAVTADHMMLIPLDITAITDHMIFNGISENFPLLFTANDIAIYNTQGFLMQLLTPQNAGIYAIEDEGTPNSFALTYDRHEFNTYRQDHAHVGGLGLDPLDRNWHTDGSYHVDHNHLVLAIRGTVENQGPPQAGVTPSFTFRVTTALADVDGGAPTVRTINLCPTSNSGSGNAVTNTVTTVTNTVGNLLGN